jgi:hypothetical protein
MCAAGNAEDLIAHHPTSNRANELSPLIKIIYGNATPLLERIAESRKAGAIPNVVGPVKLCATRQRRPRPYVRGQRVLGYCARASCSPGDCFTPAARCRKKAYCARPRLHRTTRREDDCRRARGSALQPCRQSQCYAPPGRLPQPVGRVAGRNQASDHRAADHGHRRVHALIRRRRRDESHPISKPSEQQRISGRSQGEWVRIVFTLDCCTAR